MIFLARKYQQKPRQWGPRSVVERAIAENCAKMRLPPPSLALPLWDGVGDDPISYGPYSWDDSLGFYGRTVALNGSWRPGPVLDISGSTGAIYGAPAAAFGIAKGTYFARVKGSGTPVTVGKFFTISDDSTEGDSQMNRQSDTTYRVNFGGTTYDFTSVPDIWGSGAWHDVCLSWVSAAWLKLWVDAYASENASWTGTPGIVSSYVIFGNRGMPLDRPLGCQFDFVLLFRDALNDTQVDRLQQAPYSIFAPAAQRTIFDLGRAPGSFVDLAFSIAAQSSITTDMARYAGLDATIQASTVASASMTVDRAMSASMAAVTSILASLSTDATSYVELIASIASTAGASAAMSVTRGMAAQIAATSEIVAGLARTAGMSTQLAAATDIDVTIDRQIGLSTSLGGATTASGALDRQPGMETSIGAASSISGAMAILRGMQTSMDAITSILAFFLLGTVVSEEEVILGAPLQRQVEMLSALQTEVERLSALTRQLTMYVQLTE